MTLSSRHAPRGRRGRRRAVRLACILVAAAALTAGTAIADRGARRSAPARRQSVLFWLGWESGRLTRIPWGSVTQVDLFSLATCIAPHRPAADCTGPTSISTAFNGVGNVRAFVRTVHRHGALAIISIGGSTNPNWSYPCRPPDVAAFARNLVTYMTSNGFDGVDLDIEQDSGTGSPAFTARDLLACTKAVSHQARATMTAGGRVPRVSSDVDPTTNFDIGRIQGPYVEQFNAMSYGVRGPRLAAQITALEHRSRIGASKITAGVDIGDDPPPKSDCAATARDARVQRLAGTMLWFAQADAPDYACLRALSPRGRP